MTVRPLRESDIQILQKMAELSGWPYPLLSSPLIESVLVVVDSEDKPVMACSAKRLVELYLYVDHSQPSAVKLSSMRLLHDAMANSLRGKLYDSADIFLPPPIADKFGRRLERTFGWCRNHWQNWTLRF